MSQVKNAGQLSQSTTKEVEAKKTPGSTSQTEKSKKSASTDLGTEKDSYRIPPGLKSLATTTFATNSAQRALLTKKPEGIQISRSKHWKFISSYHGP